MRWPDWWSSGARPAQETRWPGVGNPIDSLERGIAATTRLAIDPELEGVTGVFYDREQPASPDLWAANPKVQERLWQLSEQLTA